MKTTYLELLHLDYSLSERSLSYFIKSIWKYLEPNKTLHWNFHHDLICEYLELVYRREIRRLIINVPPRNLKSTIVSIGFPVWCWIKNPRLRFLFASYSESLSTKHSKDRRDIMETPWFKFKWGHVRFSSDQNVKSEYTNTQRGHMISTSITGTATGKGGNFIIIDDPHDPRRAESKSLREAAIEAFDRTFSTRLDDPKRDCIIIVMQRLHADDLSGTLLKRNSWTLLKLPAIPQERMDFILPISKRHFIVEKDTSLHEEYMPKEELKKIKKEIGSYAFNSQYLQEPFLKEGSIISRSWWKYYYELPSENLEMIQAWDLTFKGNKESNFVCGTVWARDRGMYYLVDMMHAKMDFPKTLQAIKRMSNLYPNAMPIYIEEAANGAAVVSVLKNEVPGILAVRVRGSKEERLHAVSPIIESGNVLLPKNAPWLDEFLTEFSLFPNGPNDDIVDSTTLALNKFRKQDINVIPLSIE